MGKMKKLAVLCMALAASLFVSAAAGCSDALDSVRSKLGNIFPFLQEDSSTDDGSSSDSSSSSSSSSTKGDDNTSEDSSGTPDYGHDCVWGDWELVSSPTCLLDGSKIRYCQENKAHTHTEKIAARGHDYGNTGVCSTCNTEAVLPVPDTNATYLNPAASNSDIEGSGVAFDWYELELDGYYEIEIGSEREIWFNFAVDGAGQYAVYSTSNADGISIMRFDASAQYIPTNGSEYIGFEGRTLSDGNFVSSVNCSSNLWNNNWRATFRVKGNNGDKVKIHIVRLGDEAWTPDYIKIDVNAKELDGTKAEVGELGTSPTVVPYESDFYYDKTTGYYRMGSASKPGAIIYAAITANATRLLGEISFPKIQEEGNNLALDAGRTVEGDYIIYNYAPFIMTNTSYGGSPDNSYQAFVNADGLYPVTQELYEFLNLYVENNRPVDISDDIWNNDVQRERCAWLAACYYYANLTPGTSGFPIEVDQLGDVTVDMLEAYELVYYTFKYAPETNPDADVQSASSYCTVTCNDDNVVLLLGGKTYRNGNGVREIQNIPFEANSQTGVSFMVGTLDGEDKDGEGNDITFTLTFALLEGEGSQSSPITIEEGNHSLTTVKIHALEGDYVYRAYYKYTATADGTLTLTLPAASDAQIYLGETFINGTNGSVNVEAGDEVIIIVTSTDGEPIDVNLSLS